MLNAADKPVVASAVEWHKPREGEKEGCSLKSHVQKTEEVIVKPQKWESEPRSHQEECSSGSRHTASKKGLRQEGVQGEREAWVEQGM